MKSTSRLCALAALLPVAAFANLPHAFSYGGMAFSNPTSADKVLRETSSRKTVVHEWTSPDGKHEIVFQAVGEPDWPFGYSHARIVLKRNGEIVTKRKFDVANDGGALHPENWSVRWEENCVKVIISGEEQPDAFYAFFFDGTVRHESRNL